MAGRAVRPMAACCSVCRAAAVEAAGREQKEAGAEAAEEDFPFSKV